MRRVQPAEAESGFGRLPSEFVPTPTYVITDAIRLGEPDHDRRVVSHMAETLLALAQRFFRPDRVFHQVERGAAGIANFDVGLLKLGQPPAQLGVDVAPTLFAFSTPAPPPPFRIDPRPQSTRASS